MEKTFNDTLPTGAQRDQDNQQRAQQGEPQIPMLPAANRSLPKTPKVSLTPHRSSP